MKLKNKNIAPKEQNLDLDKSSPTEQNLDLDKPSDLLQLDGHSISPDDIGAQD